MGPCPSHGSSGSVLVVGVGLGVGSSANISGSVLSEEIKIVQAIMITHAC